MAVSRAREIAEQNQRHAQATAREVARMSADQGAYQDMRTRVEKLDELTERLKISVLRLVDLAPSKQGSDLSEEAVNTLGIVADYYQRTSGSQLRRLPTSLSEHAQALRKEIATFFLVLNYTDTGDNYYAELSGFKDSVTQRCDALTLATGAIMRAGFEHSLPATAVVWETSDEAIDGAAAPLAKERPSDP